LTNVKQRDFESKPFEVMSDKDCRLRIVATPGSTVTLEGKKKGTVVKPDNEAALQVVRDNPTLSAEKIVLKLRDIGIERSRSWASGKLKDSTVAQCP
jgi:hypothetical protein